MTAIYDNEKFFKRYQQMPRSQAGLAGAGEWATLAPLLPDFTDQVVLDLGCGYGWHARYAAAHGARSVLGVDISAKMLAVARQKTTNPVITYQQGDLTQLQLPAQHFDTVFSSLALHYVPRFAPVVDQVARYLKPHGQFIFSVEHPVFTAAGSEQWHRDAQGQIQDFPVDRYFEEGARTTTFLDTPIRKYHRTLTTYLETLLQRGFQLEHVVEPQPPEAMLDQPGMRDELRRPMMLIVVARYRG
ncbi:MAG: class I SAM-dependent methyltransferase [Levilactobacillus sp.]|jgi:SAM-dependent methyltransferase|uniref:Class I SAM-dependent methyltransferase n=1 Tax=Levilactobacillus suantsaiihabitans TaxID=2487722 RepID=A0A4Z0JDY1_9LACO|nr:MULTISPECIES: class I SAM-dependent methyltransferase [Levilactobacillus]MCH4123990.1 class I SAM-dependent methyltransferase [Levilactobacillus sp.]MCI1554174.1 class I SAM-dependent methyltransferase [Levilactobacillus sp.]MCI1598927.1 class I SAM-dependent methyltransferase [Levilactobacillus sp.]MCI1606624.1 class I SAM-dependent methyltransferase [Levilactobacillus sp.]TGD19574.1 class I SAM-dependent methyltransferase [Levilactobacillus suantsaiihabitans]